MNFKTIPLFSLLTPLIVCLSMTMTAKAQDEDVLPTYVLELDEYRLAKDTKMEFCISKDDCAAGGVKIKIDAKADELSKPLLAKLFLNQKETDEVEIDLGDAYGADIHFYQIELDETNENKEVLITSFSGGAHCCAGYQVLAEYNGKLSILHLARVDGDPHYNKYKFYKGNMRFIDNRFLYAFGSYANSPGIYRFYKLEQGKKINISDEPRFKDFYQKEMEKYKASCEQVTNLEQCVGYAATAAQSGRFYEAWHYINTHYKQDSERYEQYPHFCKIETANNAPCPEDQEVRFNNFPEALLYTLKQWGYVEK